VTRFAGDEVADARLAASSGAVDHEHVAEPPHTGVAFTALTLFAATANGRAPPKQALAN
jgi:hypothetical protein